jgi:hypothetical protein
LKTSPENGLYLKDTTPTKPPKRLRILDSDEIQTTPEAPPNIADYHPKKAFIVDNECEPPLRDICDKLWA